MLQPKDIDWLNEYKSKTCINAVYNRPTSARGHIQTESEGMEMKIRRKLEQQHSQTKQTVIREIRTIHNDQGIS